VSSPPDRQDLRGPRKQGEIDPADLSAVLAHELNNIGVPLLGFVDLAAENAPQSELMRSYLDELRLGVARIAGLASDLESLAQASSHPARRAIGDCMPAAEEGDRNGTWALNWQCSASTAVKVDAFHARRAIQSLGRAAQSAATPDAPAVLVVSIETLRSASCAACGIAISPEKKHLLLKAQGPRLATARGLRNPLAPQNTGRAIRKLGLAVLVHGAHHGGGHVLFDESASSLGIVFSAD
jgi:signal transduction histidine kinase